MNPTVRRSTTTFLFEGISCVVPALVFFCRTNVCGVTAPRPLCKSLKGIHRCAAKALVMLQPVTSYEGVIISSHVCKTSPASTTPPMNSSLETANKESPTRVLYTADLMIMSIACKGIWQSHGTHPWGALEAGNLILSFQITPCLACVVLVPIWRFPSCGGVPHISPSEWDRRERPIGKKWDSRLSNFAATVIHQPLEGWQWKWLMETDRWALTFHWFVLKSSGPEIYWVSTIMFIMTVDEDHFSTTQWGHFSKRRRRMNVGSTMGNTVPPPPTHHSCPNPPPKKLTLLQSVAMLAPGAKLVLSRTNTEIIWAGFQLLFVLSSISYLLKLLLELFTSKLKFESPNKYCKYCKISFII